MHRSIGIGKASSPVHSHQGNRVAAFLLIGHVLAKRLRVTLNCQWTRWLNMGHGDNDRVKRTKLIWAEWLVVAWQGSIMRMQIALGRATLLRKVARPGFLNIPSTIRGPMGCAWFPELIHPKLGLKSTPTAQIHTLVGRELVGRVCNNAVDGNGSHNLGCVA